MRRLALPLLLLLAAPGARADEPGPTFGSPSRFTESGGAAIYRSVCAACHMPDGRGAVGAAAYPALAGDPRLAGADYPVAVVLHGLRTMPPLGEALSDEQVAAVVGYVRARFGPGDDPPTTAAAVAAAR